jgi:DNA-binding PadR family transcriptional regulator
LVKAYTEKQSKVGNARLMYILTSKGLEVAKKLWEIENIMSGKEEEIPLEEEFGIIQNHYLVHINEYDNIVRVKDGNRIAEVYISNIHGKIKLKCALCDSED